MARRKQGRQGTIGLEPDGGSLPLIAFAFTTLEASLEVTSLEESSLEELRSNMARGFLAGSLESCNSPEGARLADDLFLESSPTRSFVARGCGGQTGVDFWRLCRPFWKGT